MSSLKFAVLCVLTAYLLVVAFNFITKLRDARLMQKLLCMLFPISQICLIAFPLACSARYGLSAAVYVSLIVLGIACGPVDLLLFRALDQACRWFDSSSKVNMLQEQLRVQSALRQRSRYERDQASALRDQLRERLEQARADLRAEQAGKAGESLEGVISLIGAQPQRFCQHPAVDALVEQKARAASDSGVLFRAEIDIPADIQLPGVELCAVFSNLLDNALNACVQSPDGHAASKQPPACGGCTWSSMWRTATYPLRSGDGPQAFRHRAASAVRVMAMAVRPARSPTCPCLMAGGGASCARWRAVTTARSRRARSTACTVRA